MTKRVTTDDLSAYLDGELGALEMQRARAEIDQDPEAARLLEELRSVDAGVRRAPAEPPAAYFDALPGRIRARLPVAAPRKRWLPPVWGLAAAVLFTAVLTPLALREGPAPVVTTAPLQGAKQVDAAAPRQAPPASAAEVGTLARSEADAPLRDDQFEKRRDRTQPLESKIQPRPTPEAESEGRLRSKDDAPAATAKLKAEALTVEAQQGFAEPPHPAPATQEFGPRVNQQTTAASRGPMKKDAEAAAPPPAPAGRGGIAEEVTATQDKNAAGRRAGTAPAAPWMEDFLSRGAASATEARALREESRRFAEANPGDARADTARVRVIELGIEAWRRENRVEDLDTARADARAYLARDDARQKNRVAELLRTLTP